MPGGESPDKGLLELSLYCNSPKMPSITMQNHLCDVWLYQAPLCDLVKGGAQWCKESWLRRPDYVTRARQDDNWQCWRSSVCTGAFPQLPVIFNVAGVVAGFISTFLAFTKVRLATGSWLSSITLVAALSLQRFLLPYKLMNSCPSLLLHTIFKV